MFHKVKSIKALSDFILLVTFENNVIKYYDIKPLFKKWLEFKNLENNIKLKQRENSIYIKVDAGGYGISWNDKLDLSCNELWINGKKQD